MHSPVHRPHHQLLEGGGNPVLTGCSPTRLSAFVPHQSLNRDKRAQSWPGGHRLDVLEQPTSYPVVADPFWIPALVVVGHITRHAAMRAAQRGISQAVIKRTLENGVRSSGSQRATSVFTSGKWANKIRVVVDNKSGNIITVTKG